MIKLLPGNVCFEQELVLFVHKQLVCFARVQYNIIHMCKCLREWLHLLVNVTIYQTERYPRFENVFTILNNIEGWLNKNNPVPDSHKKYSKATFSPHYSLTSQIFRVLVIYCFNVYILALLTLFLKTISHVKLFHHISLYSH